MADTLALLNDLHTQMDALRMQPERVLERMLHQDGMNPMAPDQFERLYVGLDDLRDDRGEAVEAQELSHLHDRLDEMQQARQQEQGQAQGMEY